MTDVEKIALYNHGMAFITRKAEAEGDGALALQFKEREMNDILKSLIVVDRGEGDVAGLSYETSEDIDRLIRDKALSVSEDGSLKDLLRQIPGSLVELRVSGRKTGESETLVGRVVGLQEGNEGRGNAGGLGPQLLLLRGRGDIRFIPLSTVIDLRLEDMSAYSDVRFYMDSLISKGKKNMKGVTLFLDGEDHRLDISYISQMAPWRMSYRLFHNEDGSTIQCWGIIDNTLDEDLKEIDLTLVSGKPISFVYDLYLAQMVKRQLIREERRETTAPVELEGEKRELERDEADLEKMRDVRKLKEAVKAEPAPEAEPSRAAPLEGLADATLQKSMVAGAPPSPKKRAKRNMRPEAATERMAAPAMDGELATEAPYAGIDDLITDFEEDLEVEAVPEREATEVEDYGEAAEATVVETEGLKLPEFFLYDITSPVTIRRGQSAMVPIVQKEIACEREMVYNRLKTGGHPLVVMRMENDLDVKLERGPITVFDGNEYSGEGILPALDPTEEVRVAYAIATGVRVREDNRSETSFREIELKGGEIVYKNDHDEIFEYVIENDTLEEAGVIIEHPRSETHKLLDTEDPFEVGEELFRWKITVKPKKEVRFKVKQRNIVKEISGILDKNMWTYQKYLKEKKMSQDQFDRVKEIHDMSRRVNNYRSNLDSLKGQEAEMLRRLATLNSLASSLGYGPGELNLRNRLSEKYFREEYRLAKLRGVIFRLKKDVVYLKKALNHLFRPDKSPDFRYERPEDIPELDRLLNEQTLKYWHGRNVKAVDKAVGGG